MKADIVKNIESTFLSCERDFKMILYRLFIENKKHGDELKKLLIITTKDCLDEEHAKEYQEIIDEYSIADLINKKYITLVPRIKMKEHQDVQSYVIVSFDDFTMNANNPQYRDCTVNFDVLCQTDCWDLGEGRMRPLKICGYIDGILNDAKLSGIGHLNFMYCKELVLSAEIGLAGYTMAYRAIHEMKDNYPDPHDK